MKRILLRWLCIFLSLVFCGGSMFVSGSKHTTPTRVIEGLIVLGIGIALAFIAPRIKNWDEEPKTLASTLLLDAFLLLFACVTVPIFESVRYAASITTCISNLQQIGLAMSAYESDNDDSLPSASQWATKTAAYGGGEKHCRDAKSPFSYAMNKSLSRTRTSDLAKPGLIVLTFESDAQTLNASGGQEAFTYRHETRGTVGFADSHAKIHNQFDPKPLTWKP